MPWFSYHGGHSGQFCRHAKGQLADVVARAAAAGFTTYGLSEHCARNRLEDRYPDELDLSPADLHRMFADYVATASRLADEWHDRLEVLVGFETEVLPPASWAAAMDELRASLPRCDYIIGSVHHVSGICIDCTPKMTAEVAELVGGRAALEVAYFELVAQVADTLRPEVVGHLDLIRKFDGPSYRLSAAAQPAIERALEAVRAAGSALDINASPSRRGTGPVYPAPDILARAQTMGIPVTLGDDSHGPDDVGVGLDACMRAISAAGYREVHYLTRRSGAVELVAAPIDEVRPAR